jgi:hypothetical protein
MGDGNDVGRLRDPLKVARHRAKELRQLGLMGWDMLNQFPELSLPTASMP